MLASPRDLSNPISIVSKPSLSLSNVLFLSPYLSLSLSRQINRSQLVLNSDLDLLQLLFAWVQVIMSGVEDTSDQTMLSQKEEEAVVRKKYGGIMPKKPPLISKDHERAYFDSADWALGKQGGDKPKGPLEALRPKLQPTQQQTRYRKSPCAPADGEDGGGAPSEDTAANE